MNYKKKEAHPAIRKSQEVLIQKSQINDPRLDQDMQKILNSIVSGIKNSPPAQPRRKYQKMMDLQYKASSLTANKPGNSTNYYNHNSQLIVAPRSGAPLGNARLMGDLEDKNKLLSFDRKSLSFFVSKDNKISNVIDSLIERNDENKSFKNNITNTSQKQTPVSKQDSLKGSESSANSATNSSNRTQQKTTVPLVTKRKVGQGNVSSKITQCIDLDSQEVIEMNCGQSAKKKTEDRKVQNDLLN